MPGAAKRRRRHARSVELTPTEELELILGQMGGKSSFESHHARRIAWNEHRDELLAMVAHGLPSAAIEFEHGGMKLEDGGLLRKAYERIQCGTKRGGKNERADRRAQSAK